MKFLHSMIRVSDPAATVAFFQLLGLEERRRMDNEAGRFTLIFLGVPGDEGGEIELTHNWDRTEPYELGTGFGHLAIGVADIYGTCESLAAAGVKVPRPPGPVKGGTTVIAFIEDPDGYKIELIDRL